MKAKLPDGTELEGTPEELERFINKSASAPMPFIPWNYPDPMYQQPYTSPYQPTIIW